MSNDSESHGSASYDQTASASPSNDDNVYMFNALWFRADGGADTYARYAAAMAPILDRLGARVLDVFEPELALIGDWQPDKFFTVEYPSWDSFQSLLSDEAFRRIQHLRDEALERSLLIRCRRGGPNP